MPVERGRVEEVWPSRARNGNQYLGVQVDGKRYTVWDARLFETLEEGAYVEYEWKDRNGYPVITGVRRVEERPERESSVFRDEPIMDGSLSAEEARRLHCLRLGIEMYSRNGAYGGTSDPVDAVFEYASLFEDYVTGRTGVQKLRERETREAEERLKKLDI